VKVDIFRDKIFPFIIGVIVTIITIKLFFSGSILGYADLEKIINSKRTYSLRSSPVLDQIAYCRARYLTENHLQTHNGHQICFNKYGIYHNYGEILAFNFWSDFDIVNAWLDSQSHRNVMMMRWKFIGSSKYKDVTVVVFK
jgi:uncharacterized protein YkwD